MLLDNNVWFCVFLQKLPAFSISDKGKTGKNVQYEKDVGLQYPYCGRGEFTRLTIEEKKKVEENLNLVHRVIHDKVHGKNQWGIYTYDDLFQIGCIGLCKAVITDRGGTFSTYAYRLIQNEIMNTLVYSTRRQAEIVAADVMPYLAQESAFEEEKTAELRVGLEQAFSSVRKEAPPFIVKGLDAIILMSQGYSSREIGEKMEVTANLVCAWVSKARKFLRDYPGIKEAA